MEDVDKWEKSPFSPNKPKEFQGLDQSWKDIAGKPKMKRHSEKED